MHATEEHGPITILAEMIGAILSIPRVSALIVELGQSREGLQLMDQQTNSITAFAGAYSRQKFLNRVGDNSVYRTVCWIFLCPR
jgi:hypothetical protein